MPDATKLARAQLRQLDSSFDKEIEQDTWVKVQFNPETLKVSFANALVQKQGTEGGGDQGGGAAQQFVGAGSTKLSLQLWFDASAPPPEGESTVTDVRRLTQKVAFFITPKKVGDHYVPPAVRFAWGTFVFDGLMDSMEESLEFFSPDGRPLRAGVSISLSQQRITKFAFGQGGGASPASPGTPGTIPLVRAAFGASLPQIAASQGSASAWPSIALANGIEDALRLEPGALIDLKARF